MTAHRQELRRLAALSAPVAATQLSTVLLWTIDLAMVGRLGVEALNAVSLGRLWVMGTSIVAMGFLFGLDPYASQAHGARDAARLGSVLLHGSALALLLSLPLALLWCFAGPLLVVFGQDPAVAAVAHRYVLVQIPSLPFFLLFIVWKQFLQSRGIVRPAMWIAFAANGVNAALNWMFIYGRLGAPRLEVVGAGVATAVTQVLMLLVLLGVVRRRELLRGVEVAFRRVALRAAAVRTIAALGAPIAFQLALEYWAFAVATLWAGRLGEVELASHSIALNLASLSYMLPLGVSFGAAARVGMLIGAGNRRGARVAAWSALALGGALMLFGAFLFVVGRSSLPRLYTDDVATLAMAATLLPVAAAFQLFDGLQAVGGGVLRGMGMPRPAALANLLGYYVVALPLGWLLAFRLGLGVMGLWVGLACGLACVALLLVAWLARHPPERARALA